MKTFVLVAVCLLAASVLAEKEEANLVGSTYGGGYAQSAVAPAAPVYAAPAAQVYAAQAPVGVPAPPCPKNYLFSCQPNLTPVPCSAPAPSYGSAGAYSQYAPVYAPRPLRW